MNYNARLIAYYLPQFHPVAENDEWWGKGFTEWTNVAKAQPLFKGHWQPRLPADLGFYDLRVPEARIAQAEMAQTYGIEAFCYYHYWFGNERRLLERPFNEVLASGEPDFPFCLSWANITWTGVWYGAPNRVLIEQQYGGRKDYEQHFEYLLRAFEDPRYLRVDDKPLFQVLAPLELPDAREFTDTFRELAQKRGLKDLFLVSGYIRPTDFNPLEHGFDAVVSSKAGQAMDTQRRLSKSLLNRALSEKRLSNEKIQQTFKKQLLDVYRYEDVIESMLETEEFPFDYYPCAMPNWDNTPRSGTRGRVVIDSTPELFRKHLQAATDYVQKYPDEHKIVFVKAWNEWAEGNYLEPDTVFGHKYLEVVKDVISS